MNQLSRNDSSTINETAATDISAGAMAIENGLVKFYSRDVASGKAAAPMVKGVRILVDKEVAANVFAVGEVVDINATNQTAMLAGAGDQRLGICAAASANGDLQVDVRLNE